MKTILEIFEKSIVSSWCICCWWCVGIEELDEGAFSLDSSLVLFVVLL
jgi:hypothetical protein